VVERGAVIAESLRGKAVLLVSDPAASIAQVLRDLRLKAIPRELVALASTAEVSNERNLTTWRILVRYETAPRANDANHVVWRRYGAQAWLTRVIIDPAGNLVGTAMGEGNLEGFVNAIQTVIRVLTSGRIDRNPLPLNLERVRHRDRPL
jgi:hypothetical protein